MWLDVERTGLLPNVRHPVTNVLWKHPHNAGVIKTCQAGKNGQPVKEAEVTAHYQHHLQ